MAIRLTEIFFSLQGETATTGLPTVFVRLTGCPMRCTYCDTSYAFSGGKKWEIQDIVHEVQKYQCQHVTVTGGEPLAQQECHDLIKTLCDLGYKVSLETGGAIDISQVDERVYIALDVKTPASNEEKNNRWENFDYIKDSDCLKFVICDEHDYVWAKELIDKQNLDEKCELIFSPSTPALDARVLAEWIIRDQLPVRFQVQLHKILWDDARGK